MNNILQGTTPHLIITVPVTVAAIPYSETLNTYGTTVSIG